jgi:hypothetical protein
MNIKNFYLLLILSLFFLSKSEETPEPKVEQDDNNNETFEEDGDLYFKKTLKDYLVEKNLFESDRIIEPDEMKKIFLESVTEGDAESSADYFGGIFIELADYFVNEYYKERKEIRGKDIYNIIELDPISKKFEQLMNDNSKYNGEEVNKENNNDYNDYNDYDDDPDRDYNYFDDYYKHYDGYDYRDHVGDPIEDN